MTATRNKPARKNSKSKTVYDEGARYGLSRHTGGQPVKDEGGRIGLRKMKGPRVRDAYDG